MTSPPIAFLLGLVIGWSVAVVSFWMVKDNNVRIPIGCCIATIVLLAVCIGIVLLKLMGESR